MDKTFKVYQKDKDKGKGKVGGVPPIQITDNLPPPAQDIPPVHTVNPSDMGTEDVILDNTNPDSEILFSMNVDKQNINIVVDKETAEVKAYDVKNSKVSEILAHTIDSQKIEILAQDKEPKTEKHAEDKGTNTEKPSKEKVQTQIETPKENVSKKGSN